MNRRFWHGPGDGEIIRRAATMRIELCRDDEGDVSGEFEIRGYFGAGGMAEFCGLPADDDALAFARHLMAQFERGKPPGALL